MTNHPTILEKPFFDCGLPSKSIAYLKRLASYNVQLHGCYGFYSSYSKDWTDVGIDARHPTYPLGQFLNSSSLYRLMTSRLQLGSFFWQGMSDVLAAEGLDLRTVIAANDKAKDTPALAHEVRFVAKRLAALGHVTRADWLSLPIAEAGFSPLTAKVASAAASAVYQRSKRAPIVRDITPQRAFAAIATHPDATIEVIREILKEMAARKIPWPKPAVP